MNKKVNFQDLRAEKNERYRQQEAEAKKAFLKETGKKIAVGFKETDEYKRIQKNKRQALRRLEKKKIQYFAEGKRRKLKGAKVVTKEVRNTGRLKFYWEMLTAEGEAVMEWREAEQSGGKIPGVDLFGVVVDYDGNKQVYGSEFYFVRAISELAKEASKLQERVTVTTVNNDGKKEKKRETTYYPQVQLIIITDTNGSVYIVVRAVPKTEVI